MPKGGSTRTMLAQQQMLVQVWPSSGQGETIAMAAGTTPSAAISLQRHTAQRRYTKSTTASRRRPYRENGQEPARDFAHQYFNVRWFRPSDRMLEVDAEPAPHSSASWDMVHAAPRCRRISVAALESRHSGERRRAVDDCPGAPLNPRPPRQPALSDRRAASSGSKSRLRLKLCPPPAARSTRQGAHVTRSIPRDDLTKAAFDEEVLRTATR